MIDFSIPLETINREHLLALVDGGATESVSLDFKRSIDLSSGDAKRELLKDLTAFANTLGGHLIIGVDEREGSASALIGCQGNPDALIQTIENLLRDGVQPRLTAHGMVSVPLANGFALVVRVYPSVIGPHRVSHGSHNRFYVRNANGKHEASVEELRTMFVAGASQIDRLKQRLARRYEAISHDEGPVDLVTNEGLAIVHLTPAQALMEFGGLIDPRTAYPHREKFAPIGASDGSTDYNFDGLLIRRGGDRCHGYTQIFRDGTVETLKTDIVVSREEWGRILPAVTFRRIVEAILRISNAQRIIGVTPPIFVSVKLIGLTGALLGLSDLENDDLTRFRQDEMAFRPLLLDRFHDEQSVAPIVQPLLDQAWQAAGLSRCNLYGADGTWPT